LTPNTAANQIRFGDVQDNGSGIIEYNHNNAYMAFNTNGPERMRIDSSGNLLVGTTSADNGDAGFEARSDGRIFSTATSNSSFNRLSSDGDIVTFQKDTVKVGSIGSYGNSLYIDGGSSNYSVMLASDFRPRTSNGAANNNGNIDLGDSGARWKDLYLSGGVYLGGTGSANKLDDYEEGYVSNGTITPQTSGTITTTSAFNALNYTKIGRQVTVTGAMDITSVSSPVGDYVTISLPFPVADIVESGGYGAQPTGYHDNSTANRSILFGITIEGTSDLRVYIDASTISGSDDFYVNCTYFTT